MTKLDPTKSGEELVEQFESSDIENAKKLQRRKFHERKVRDLQGDAMKTKDPVGYIRQSLQDLPDFNTVYTDDDIIDMLVNIEGILNHK